jgi:hypothetical protein
MFRHTGHPVFLAAVLAAAAVLPIAAQRPAPGDKPDLDAVYRIKEEGLQHSKVMEITSYLTDIYGPRLTGSPNLKEAAEWTERTMKEWGLVKVHQETFPFGRGWQNQRFVAMAVTPRSYPLIAYPKPWTPGTNGPVTGDAIIAVIQSEKDFEEFRGKLRGKFVLAVPMRDVPARYESQGRRYTDTDLENMAKQPAQRGRGPGNANNADPGFPLKKAKFWVDEGVAAVLDFSPIGDGGTVFVQNSLTGGGSLDPKDPPVAPQVTLAVEHYGRIWRTLEKKVPVTLEMDIQNRFFDSDLNSFNILGEIPGSDKADEVVMLGAHFDSWDAATGATDNAAGSAVMLEAMRILKTTGLHLRRTVRVGLWTGEEEGLLGSREYVKAHFGDVKTGIKPDQAKVTGYFNVDNGSGQIRGVYLQGNESIAPVFTAWMEPFHNMGMKTLAIRNTGGTDHLNFDAVGIPGFQFIQDEVEYFTRTHHSNMDTYERVQPTDMMNNAVIVASFVYNAANREEKLPRKPLPKPAPARGTN